jgi:AraC-like DNA-binding protein
VLAAFLRELVTAAGELEPERLAELGWTTIDLLATALRAAAGQDAPVVGRQAVLRALREYVAAHLNEPELTPALLARSRGVSPRYVAELFAESGTSPAAFIRDERLKAAHRALADPRQVHRTIAAIAARSGFADRTTFTRAFVRRYGVTPTEVRAARSA